MKSKPRRRPGRPSRAEASAKALADVDLTAIDPKAILLAIAGDTSAAATARLAACRALLAQAGAGKVPADGEDAVTKLALQLLRRKP